MKLHPELVQVLVRFFSSGPRLRTSVSDRNMPKVPKKVPLVKINPMREQNMWGRM